jgi:GTP-binding protein
MKINVSDAKFLREIKRADDAPKPALPAVAFAGRSNVGKSSLINSLVRRKGLAKTSNTPGRTQSIIYFEVAGKYHFVDLPGYGYAKVPPEVKAQWGPMVERFLKQAENLRLVIVLLDARHEPTSGDRQLVNWLEAADVPYFFVMTKADKLGKNVLKKQIGVVRRAFGLIDEDAILPYSAVTGQGRDDLLRVLFNALDGKDTPATKTAADANE